MLVHEATFCEDERERARETLHSTAADAAELAREADVVLLALTHLSSRYFGHDVVREARAVFAETVVPRDFDVIEVPFRERGAPQLVKSGARTSRRARARLRSRSSRDRGRMTRMVQAAVAGDITEAEEIQEILRNAGHRVGAPVGARRSADGARARVVARGREGRDRGDDRAR